MDQVVDQVLVTLCRHSRKLVEAAGIEPASESTPLSGNYMLVPRFVVIRRIGHGPPARRTISE